MNICSTSGVSNLFQTTGLKSQRLQNANLDKIQGTTQGDSVSIRFGNSQEQEDEKTLEILGAVAEHPNLHVDTNGEPKSKSIARLKKDGRVDKDGKPTGK